MLKNMLQTIKRIIQFFKYSEIREAKINIAPNPEPSTTGELPTVISGVKGFPVKFKIKRANRCKRWWCKGGLAPHPQEGNANMFKCERCGQVKVLTK